MISFLISVLIFISSNLWANCNHALLLKPFQENYHETYIGGDCSRNISVFIRDIVFEDMDLSNAKVLIFPGFRMNHIRTDRRSIYASTTYQGLERFCGVWNYHVVLYLDGFIYDFDYTNKPVVVSYADYLRDAVGVYEEDRTERLNLDSEIYVIHHTNYINKFGTVMKLVNSLALRQPEPKLPRYVHKKKLSELLK